jgi:hemerythrin-like metal-binding protein
MADARLAIGQSAAVSRRYTEPAYHRDTIMTVLAWSEALALGYDEMDSTHQDFVALLNAVSAAEGEAILPALDAFIAHTEAHFAQEEAWMAQTAYPRSGCHEREHHNVLEVVHEVRSRVASGNLDYGRRLAEALADWFPGHASSMDAMLAIYLQQGADALPECSHEGSESCPNSGREGVEHSHA